MLALKPKLHTNSKQVLAMLSLAGLLVSTLAQEVSIPDPGLNAAIREALQKPIGALTEQDMLTLTNLDACCRNVTNVTGVEAARNLTSLNLQNNQLTSFNYPTNLTSLQFLNLTANPFTNVFFPDGLTNLTSLAIQSCGLTKLTLPAGMTSLISLQLSGNQFTNLTLPANMMNLKVMDLGLNQLTNFILPVGLTNLNVLALEHNQLTSLTLPPDMTGLTSLVLGGNPLTSFVLSDVAATNQLPDLVASLRSGDIPVFTYPLTIQIVKPLPLIGAFKLGITGPPGVYTVLGSTDLATWFEVGFASNAFGGVNFVDIHANQFERKFYRVQAP